MESRDSHQLNSSPTKDRVSKSPVIKEKTKNGIWGGRAHTGPLPTKKPSSPIAEEGSPGTTFIVTTTPAKPSPASAGRGGLMGGGRASCQRPRRRKRGAWRTLRITLMGEGGGGKHERKLYFPSGKPQGLSGRLMGKKLKK